MKQMKTSTIRLGFTAALAIFLFALALLALARPEGLIDRDVVVIADTDPAARSAIRTKLRPRGFMLVLIAKVMRMLLMKKEKYYDD